MCAHRFEHHPKFSTAPWFLPMPYLLRCVHNLESAIELLNKEFATCEILKLDAAPLRDEKTPMAESDSYLAFTFLTFITFRCH